MDLLDYYRDNLSYLRILSAEFAEEFPKIARRLLLSEFDCQDPYIERLIEGTAFLSAKVEKKLDEGYYPFLEAVLNSIAPDALYPVPSGGVMEVSPNMADETIRRGAILRAGTVFETVIPGINTPCRFSTVEDTPLFSFSVTGAEYINHDVASLGIKNNQSESALRLRFASAAGGDLNLNGEIRLFFSLSEADASLLLRLLVHDAVGVYLKQGEDYQSLKGVRFTIPMTTGEKLLGQKAKSNTRGLRILQNFLSYPDFFKFLSIQGMRADGGTTAELVIAFKRREQALAAAVKGSSIRVNCVPAINLFSRRSDRVTMESDGDALSDYEYHLVPDRTAMRDYEVSAVTNIDFFNERNELISSASSFYDNDITRDREKQIFFSAKRRRKLVNRRSTARSTYDGTEMFVSFSPLPKGAWQFAADILATNRDLPLLLQGGAEFSSPSTLARRAVFLALPTRPDYPLTERGEREDFSRLSHIMMNLSAILCQEGEHPLELLRNMLRSYPIRPPEEMTRMISGIIALSGTSDSFRFIRNGVVFYEWGWRITLTLDENDYAGMGFYLFAKIIAEMLLSFTPINTMVEIRFSTLQSGVIAVWKTLENQ